MGSCVSGPLHGATSTDAVRASSLQSLCPVASVFSDGSVIYLSRGYEGAVCFMVSL